MTLSLDMFAAGAGDAFVVCAGIDSGRVWTAVVDGGPPGTPDQGLKQFLWDVATPPLSVKASAYVDLLAVTHIDSDHIGGAIDLMADTPAVSTNAVAGFSFGTVWHNSFAELTGDSALIASGQIRLGVQARLTMPQSAAHDPQQAIAIVASVTQGQDLRDLIAANGVEGNHPLSPVIRQGDAARWANEPLISIVGPTQRDIDALQKYWMREVNENLSASHRTSYAAAGVDQSVPNLSSLVFLFEYGGCRILFTGDARGDRIVEQLDDLGYLRNGPLDLDAMKVPHHGSERSCSDTLFRNVRADNYLFSGDGSNGNPSLVTADRLCRARPNDEFAVWLTHDIPAVTARFRSQPRIKVIVRATNERSLSIRF